MANPHPSQRGFFAEALYEQMKKNPDIYLVTGDLGYKMWDRIQEEFPDRFINVGAAEQIAMGLAIGLALKGKIPFVYSITSFLIYRPFETIRTYLNHEQIPVKLVGSGRGNQDYPHDGFSHASEEIQKTLGVLLPNIVAFWPDEKEQVAVMVEEMVKNQKPSFISLKRK